MPVRASTRRCAWAASDSGNTWSSSTFSSPSAASFRLGSKSFRVVGVADHGDPVQIEMLDVEHHRAAGVAAGGYQPSAECKRPEGLREKLRIADVLQHDIHAGPTGDPAYSAVRSCVR